MKMRSLLTLIMLFVTGVSAFATTDRYRLMFNSDPATEITIGWEQVSGSNPIVYYGTTDHGTNWASYSNNEPAYRTTNYMGMTNKFAILSSLSPNTVYYFVVKDDEGTSQRYWFRTSPNINTEKLSFISGGDSRSGQTQRRNSNRMVAKIRPHAVLFGGDLVNTPGNSSVQTWFDDWMLTISSDGQMFPIVHSFGNHEEYGTGGPEFINELFDTDYDVYYRVTFGGDLFSVYTLNGELLPGHTIANASKRNAQTAWLLSELQNDNSIWKSAQYHRPIVPHYSGKGEGDDEFDDWANAFYDYGVRLVMESDAHVTKMTEEVKPAMTTASGNSSGWFTTAGIDPNKGITFIGEGAWGTIRTPDDSHPLTTAMTSMYQFAWITVDNCAIEIRTIDTQSPGTVPEHSAGDYFSVSAGLDAQIWKPTGLSSGVREIRRCNPPDPDFSANMTSAFTGQQIDFTDLSTNTPTSWSWDFGDGNNATAQNPSNTYTTSGTYTVSLTATNADGSNTETKTGYIVISDPVAPIADFTVDNTTPNATQTINFSDLSVNNPTSWSWDFGDGNNATAQNPSHAYTNPGVYTVTLTATNAYGTDDEIKTAYIDVQSGGSVSVTVATGNDDAEEFRVGGAQGDMYLTSSDLEIGNDGGTEQYVGIRFQNVDVPQGATITNAKIVFRADESDGSGSQLNIYIVGEDVDNSAQFNSTDYNISTRPTTTAMYTWPDGSVPAWSAGNIYDTPELSTVVQEIVDRGGWNSGNAMSFILYSDLGESSERVADSYEGSYPAELVFDWSVPSLPAPVANFSSNSTTICVGESVSFSDGSSNTPTSWSWDFGDGNNSSVQNPTHTYSSAGTYSITLTASNSGGSDVISQTNYITVVNNPTVSTSLDQSICLGDNVTISASGASTYVWDNLGSGASHTVSPTMNTTYTVTGTDNGCSAQSTVTISVNPIPVVTTSSDVDICDGDNTTISASGASTFVWDNLGAGSSHTVSPTTNTTYTVTGTTSGCSAQETVNVTVTPIPTLTLTSDQAICSGDNVTISVSGANSYSWDNSLGGGTTHSVSPTSNTTYTVTGSTNGCDAQESVTITVNTQSNPGVASPLSVCVSETNVDLNTAISGEDGGGTWLDTDGTGALTGNTVDASALSVGNTYNFTYEFAANGACPSVQEVTQITVISTVDAGTATSINETCTNSTSFDLFDGISGNDLGGTWNDDDATGALTGNQIDGTMLTAGTYDFTYAVNGGACGTDSETITITVNTPPAITASQDVDVCEGDDATLTVTGGTSYTWNNGLGAGSSQTVSPTTTTTYTVTGSDGVCESTDDVTITVNDLPVVSLNAFEDDTICEGSSKVSLPMGSPVGGSYNGTGVSGNSFDPSIAGQGNHVVSYDYTDGNGCSNSSTTTITIVSCLGIYDDNDEPIFSIYPNPSSDNITIERDQPSEYSIITIYDMSGKRVYMKNEIKNPLVISIERWERGTYIIEFSNSGGEKITKKLVVQ